MSVPSFSNNFQPWTLIGIWRDTPAPVVQTSRHQRLKGESSLPRTWPSQPGVEPRPCVVRRPSGPLITDAPRSSFLLGTQF